MKIEVNGVTLHYEVEGKGRPLLLVHGNTQDHKIFYEGVKILKEHFTCYMVDSRGHGESSKVDEYHYDDFADDYIEFCHKLGLKDIYYYGLSDGGILGLLIASKSDLIQKMVISGTNTNPKGAKSSIINIMRILYFFTRDKRMLLVFNEPNISVNQLRSIQAKTLVCAGSNDVIRLEDTHLIADHIPNAKLNIMEGEDHTSTVCGSDKFAYICMDFFGLE